MGNRYTVLGCCLVFIKPILGSFLSFVFFCFVWLFPAKIIGSRTVCFLLFTVGILNFNVETDLNVGFLSTSLCLNGRFT